MVILGYFERRHALPIFYSIYVFGYFVNLINQACNVRVTLLNRQVNLELEREWASLLTHLLLDIGNRIQPDCSAYVYSFK